MVQADELNSGDAEALSPFPAVRTVNVGHPFMWLARGVGDIRHNPLPSLFYGSCFALMAYVMTIVFHHAYEYLAALISGFLLVGPSLAMGLYEISRRHEQNKICHLGPTLFVWRRNLSNVGIFSVVLGIIFLLWARASLVTFALFYTHEIPKITEFLTDVVTFDNIDFLAIYAGVGLIFATISFAISVVSIPLMLDRNQDAITAMIASVIALIRNPGTMVVWALIIVTATIIGFATFYLGLIVLIPMIGHATWHAYRDIVEPLPTMPQATNIRP